jgi:hypothetical protein
MPTRWTEFVYREDDINPKDHAGNARAAEYGLAECLAEPSAERDKRQLRKTAEGTTETVGRFKRNGQS